MEGHDSRIGKAQMLQYTGDLYENPMVVYREYLQNACDAVEDALEAGLIQDRRKATIAVTIDHYNRTISIRDKGIGIPADKIGRTLVDVASSQKLNRAGHYGIGRLNGANYCDVIRYETSFRGETIKSTLDWNVKEARKICEDKAQDPTVEEVINRVTFEHPKEEADIEDHYCTVSLINVNNDDLLDEEKVREYISQIVPVDYSFDFKDNVRNPSLKLPCNSGYKEKFDALRIYKISVNDEAVEKKYASVSVGNEFTFRTISCFTVKEPQTNEELAWGWFAMNDEVTQMNYLPEAQIRGRLYNFQIGTQDMFGLLHKDVRSRSYFIGEIHITHPSILPTTSRDGIINSPQKELLYLGIQSLFKRLYDIYNHASKLRSEGIDKIAAQRKIIAEKKILLTEADEEEKKRIRQEIADAKVAIETATSKAQSRIRQLKNDGAEFAISDIISGANSTTIATFNDKANGIKTNNRVPNITIAQIVPPEPAKKLEGNGEEKTTFPGDNNNSNPTGQYNSKKPEGEGDSTPSVDEAKEELEIYRRTLSTVEYRLMRKVYNVINTTGTLTPAIKAQIKKSLQKKIAKKK